ncbi:hypothetical protein SAMN04488556_3409 [Halostagnicola kamekurae]|uniref:Uncharacterized protein n=1 Tax=Halostagnicola kamekurae TaxID=619731 RepID=A0A1I6TTB0_9EURY|nr:hypothetical protein SAMN04488556_3409 [Halostagnicola kamekurae]
MEVSKTRFASIVAVAAALGYALYRRRSINPSNTHDDE